MQMTPQYSSWSSLKLSLAADIAVQTCLALNQERLVTIITMITNVITKEICRKSASCATKKVTENSWMKITKTYSETSIKTTIYIVNIFQVAFAAAVQLLYYHKVRLFFAFYNYIFSDKSHDSQG